MSKELTLETIEKNEKALRLLRRSYKAKKDFAYGLKAYKYNCPLCHEFFKWESVKEHGCRGCVWAEMGKENTFAPCEDWLKKNIAGFESIGALKANKGWKQGIIKKRLNLLEKQLEWLARKKAQLKRGKK